MNERRIPGFKRGEPFVFRVDGRPITAYPGETVAAALLAVNIHPPRLTPEQQQPRPGFFCGMGICHGCVLLIDNVPQRACLALAAPDINVSTTLRRGS